MIKIDRKLNLVQPVEFDGGTGYIHSMPLSYEIWEVYSIVLAKTYAAIFTEGLSVASGPPFAGLLLKHIAQNMGIWDTPGGVEKGLVAEIRRLTNVVMPGAAGWQTIPYEEVVRRETIDRDTLSVAEGAIIFFICVSVALRGSQSRKKLSVVLDGVTSLWGLQTSSLDVTAFAASLPTSTPAANSGAKPPPASSLPG